MRIEYNSKESWEKRIECGECMSVFVAEHDDLKYTSHHSGSYYVACPVCREWAYFDKDDLPNFIKDEAKTAWQLEQDEQNIWGSRY